MREINVPGGAPARNDKVHIWSRELASDQAIVRLQKMDTENEIRDYVQGEYRDNIKLAAKMAIQRLRKANESSQTGES